MNLWGDRRSLALNQASQMRVTQRLVWLRVHLTLEMFDTSLDKNSKAWIQNYDVLDYYGHAVCHWSLDAHWMEYVDVLNDLDESVHHHQS